MAAKIEDYALIRDCETAAIVDNNGSIDWLCWPNFSSEACFASKAPAFFGERVPALDGAA